MATLTCPSCQGEMTSRSHDRVTVRQCGECEGVFLERAQIGSLVEAETDWHAHQSTDTARLPRITADMPAPKPRPRSYVESLFQS